MATTKRTLESLLFNEETTNKNDFRSFAIREPRVTRYEPKPRCQYIRPPPLKDVHTLSDWKNSTIPFNLLHSRKDIIGTRPTDEQKVFERVEDADLEEAIKTRPRLVMTPALCMDDIAETRVRDILIDSMYTSCAVKAQKEVARPYFSVRAPLPKVLVPAKSVALPKLRPPLVSPEWKMESITWDQKQHRCYCASTREFWLRRDPPRCQKCEESATVTQMRKTRLGMM